MKKGLVLFWITIFFSSLEARTAPCHPSNAPYTKIFSIATQYLHLEEPVRFEKIKTQSHEIDLSFAASSGLIIFRRPGTYKLVWRGLANSPFNRPWTLGFSLDGVTLLGNIYGPSARQKPPAPFEGSVVLNVNAGQSFRFINSSSHPVELVPGKTVDSPSFALSIFYSDLSYLD